MTQHWIDIKNANAVLIMGSNAAEHHPISFKWVLKAKDAGAKVIHVDPKFSRTSARSDMHVPLRSGTDIAFLGGMLKYILDNNLIQKEYVTEYTNASFIVGDDYEFKDGLFSGYDATTRKYDRKKWAFAKDEKGVPKRDKTLKDPRCVYQLMAKHYERYDLDTVSSITGVSKENLLAVYEIYAATGKPDKAGTMMYALGWTQHTVGVQNIRLAAMIQLLLGNIGVAGGGVNALRGEPNVQAPRTTRCCGTSFPDTTPCRLRPGPLWRSISRPTRPSPTTPKASTGGATGPSTWSVCSRAGSATRPLRKMNSATLGCPRPKWE